MKDIRPIVTAFGLFVAIVSLRAFDLFVLRVDSWPDPTIVSKTLGLLLVSGTCALFSITSVVSDYIRAMLRMPLVLVD